jgi:hypothetical protein
MVLIGLESVPAWDFWGNAPSTVDKVLPVVYCAEGSPGEFRGVFRLGRSAVFPFRPEGMVCIVVSPSNRSPSNKAIISAKPKGSGSLSLEDADTASPPVQIGIVAKPPLGRAWACACIASTSISVSCGGVE